MIWVFSHCPADRPQTGVSASGCEGCPALAGPDGKPRADNCEAVFMEVRPARVPCQVIGCKRTTAPDRIAPHSEYLCPDHWRLVDRRTKRLLRQVHRKAGLLSDPGPMHRLANRVWDRAKAQAIERAMGIRV